MKTLDDDEIRALLEPLRHDAPTRSEIDEAVLSARAPAPRRRPRLHWGIAATAAAGAAAVLAAVALWPAGEPSQTARSRSVASAFRLASANAAEQVDRGLYRFTRLRVSIDHPNVDMSSCKPLPAPRSAKQAARLQAEIESCAKPAGRSTTEFTTEQWVDKSLQGRIVSSPFKETDASGHVTTAGGAHDGKFMFGDTLIADAHGRALTDFDALPTDPAALEPRLAELGLHGYAPEVAASASARDYIVVQSAIALLTYPKITPALRAAVFGVLARINGFRDLGEATDALGRHGRRVEIAGPADGLRNGGERVTISLLFDPDRAELLSWVETTEHPNGAEVRTSLIETAANVADTSTQP
jgi:hypothetical protein